MNARNPRRSLWARRLLQVSLLLEAVLAGPVLASVAMPGPTDVPAITVPDAGNPAQIVAQADQDERLAIAAIERSTGAGSLSDLTSRMQDLSRSTDQRLRALGGVQLARLPVRRLESLERHWRFDQRLYQRWRQDMEAVSAPYLADATELSRRRGGWDERLRAGRALPPVLAERIRAVIQVLERAEQANSGPLARQMALSEAGNVVGTRIESALADVAAAIATIDRRLWQRDAPALWFAEAWQPEHADDGLTAVAGLQIESDFASAYARTDAGNQVLLHVLQLGLLPFLLWVRRYSRGAVDASHLGADGARVLQRPWSTWLLLGMVGTLVLEPDAPILVHQLSLLVALVPVLRLVPRQNRQLLDHWPYVASTLFLLAGMGILVLANAVLYRLYVLGLSVVALAATIWLLRRAYARGHAAQTGRLGRTLRALAWMAVALLAVALIAGVVGNVSLAEMLSLAVIDSAYLALLLYVGVAVIRTGLHLLLAATRGNQHRVAQAHVPALVILLGRVVMLAAVVGWTLYAMDAFRILRPASDMARAALGHQFTLGAFSLSLGHVLAFVVALFIAVWASRITRLLLRDVLADRMGGTRGIGTSIASLGSYAVLMLGIIFALSAAGFQSSQLALVFGALGVGVGFGLQNVVNNFVSGLILMFERPIQPGDMVDAAGASGQVRDIGMRATRIKTFDGADVVVPNGKLLSDPLTNWTLLDRHRRVELEVGVAYGSDPRAVIALLERCAAETPGVASAPAPMALFMQFGESSLDFSLRVWIPDVDRWLVVRSDLGLRIHDALREAGIDLPFPQRDVHVHLPRRSPPSAETDTGAQHQPTRPLR